MTNPNISHITLVADRSGSMADMLQDAQGGINTFIAEQKKGPGRCTLYFVEFDTMGTNVVHDGPIETCPIYSLVPQGGTPLLDAVGNAINETGRRLAALPESERPGHVFFVVQTDGQENASREFRLHTLTALIKQQENQWKWNFIFLATGPEAFGQAQMFVGTQMLNNTYRGTTKNLGSTYSTASAAMVNTRAGAAAHFGGVIPDEPADETAPAPTTSPRTRPTSSTPARRRASQKT